jgi:osmoprotectant transport system substrate-binding protein
MDRRSFLSSLLAVSVVGCTRSGHNISVGSKNFTEQLILGEILAQALERAHVNSVDRRFYLAGSYICQQAILAGRISMYVEYTGTALAAILKEPIAQNHSSVLTTVQREYQKRFGLTVLPSLGFNNSFAMVMRGEDARRMKVHTLSQLAPFAPQLRMGIGYEFLEREDGYRGLVKTYGLKFREEPRVMDLGLIYRALQARQVDIVAGSNTDGQITALDLTVLEDDRNYFPPYDAVPIVRPDALAKPGVRAALDSLTGRITADAMRKMNYAVDGEHKDAAEVAREFLSNLRA